MGGTRDTGPAYRGFRFFCILSGVAVPSEIVLTKLRAPEADHSDQPKGTPRQIARTNLRYYIV